MAGENEKFKELLTTVGIVIKVDGVGIKESPDTTPKMYHKGDIFKATETFVGNIKGDELNSLTQPIVHMLSSQATMWETEEETLQHQDRLYAEVKSKRVAAIAREVESKLDRMFTHGYLTQPQIAAVIKRLYPTISDVILNSVVEILEIEYCDFSKVKVKK